MKILCRKRFLKIKSRCVLQTLYFTLTGCVESHGRGKILLKITPCHSSVETLFLKTHILTSNTLKLYIVR